MVAIRSNAPWLYYIDEDLDYINLGIRIEFTNHGTEGDTNVYERYTLISFNVGIRVFKLFETIFPSEKEEE